jgi:hypothetical protein
LALLATLTGGRYADGELALAVFDAPVLIAAPDFRVLDGRTREPTPVNTEALILYHLCTTDGAPLTGRWVSFRELPDGGFYHQAFQGYTGHRIATHFGNDLARIRKAAQRAGGDQESVGDAGYRFAGLPRVPMALVYWLGEDPFPPAAHILFDASAGHHLPVDACALLGSALTRRLIEEVSPTL